MPSFLTFGSVHVQISWSRKNMFSVISSPSASRELGEPIARDQLRAGRDEDFVEGQAASPIYNTIIL